MKNTKKGRVRSATPGPEEEGALEAALRRRDPEGLGVAPPGRVLRALEIVYGEDLRRLPVVDVVPDDPVALGVKTCGQSRCQRPRN